MFDLIKPIKSTLFSTISCIILNAYPGPVWKAVASTSRDNCILRATAESRKKRVGQGSLHQGLEPDAIHVHCLAAAEGDLLPWLPSPPPLTTRFDLTLHWAPHQAFAEGCSPPPAVQGLGPEAPGFIVRLWHSALGPGPGELNKVVSRLQAISARSGVTAPTFNMLLLFAGYEV